MRILIAHNRYQLRSGEDAVVDAEYELLRRHGQEVHLFLRDNRDIAALSVARKSALLWRTAWSRQSYTDLLAELDRLQPDVVHVHNTLPLLSPSIYAACARRRVPVVQTLHNFRLYCPAATFFRNGHICHDCVETSLFAGVRHGCYRGSRAQTLAVAAMLRTLHKPAGPLASVSRFIVLTRWHRQRFAALGLPQEKLVVKPNFLPDTEPQQRTPADYVLFIGRLAGEKGVLRLLDIWQHLPDIPLRIAGDGPLWEAVRTRAHELPQVRVLGRITPERRAQLLAGARFLVVPSLWQEGLPLVVLEAFAAGVPVAVSDLGALPAVVPPECGVHFTPLQSRAAAAKLRAFNADAAALQNASRAARREYQTTYSSATNYRMLIAIYEQAIAEASS